MSRPATPPLPSDSCSLAWRDGSAFGTAPRASFWVALEQPGPWGRDAFTESHLDAELGARLQATAADHGGRALLIRAPGQHADAHTGPRTVFVAGGLAGSAWLLAGRLDDPATLLGLPWDRLAQTRPPALDWLTPHPPVLLVCTNAKRDRCCALTGRPLAAALAARGRPVWECSHTGGHRFAPTGVVLPFGQSLARMTPDLAEQALDAAACGRFAIGTLNEEHDRGVSWLSPVEQAAVSWVRAQQGYTEAAGLVAVASGNAVTVVAATGRSWEVVVTETPLPARAESCGKPAKVATELTVAPA